MSKPVLAYWDIRGFAQQIRLLLQYLGVDYEDKRYPFGPAPDFSRDAWLNEKFGLGLQYPNLPYWIDDDVKLSESKAILKYIARVKGPALIPSDPKEMGKAEMWEGYANDLQRALVNLAYSKTKGEGEEPLQQSLAKSFEQLAEALGKSKWALGDKLSFVDFFLYEVLFQYVKYDSEFLKPYPALLTYIENFEALPELKDYVKSSANLVCYSPFATTLF